MILRTLGIAYILIGMLSCSSMPLKVEIGDGQYKVKKVTADDFDYVNTEDNQVWETANVLRDFVHPWRNDSPIKTTFRALYNSNYMYLWYEVKDTNLLIYEGKGEELDLGNSDRVEIFFLSKGDMHPYYSVEWDPHGKVLDYEMEYHRIMNTEWDYPEGEMDVATKIQPDGYTVLVRFSMSSLHKLKAFDGNVMYAGLYRANVVDLTNNEPTFQWICWVDPHNSEADFHIPATFGRFIFEDWNE